MAPHVAIYARYSTERQDESSIKVQVENCRALAEREGFEVVEVIKDEGLSGAETTRDPDTAGCARRWTNGASTAS